MASSSQANTPVNHHDSSCYSDKLLVKILIRVNASSEKETIDSTKILFGAVNSNIHRTLSCMPNSKVYDMYQHLQKHFWMSSRARQQNLLRKMLGFKVSDYPLTKDQILAMMLQCKTNQGLAIQQEVDRWVENYFHTQENYNFPRPTVGSDYVIYTLDAFKHHVATTAQHQEFPLPALTLLLPSASAPIQFMNLASTNNEEVTGLAACPRLCLECCSLDHFGGFQGFYPILAPPGVVGTYPQLGQLLRYQRGDHQAGHQSFQHPHPFIQASNGGHQPLTRGQPPRRMVEIGELDDTLEEPSGLGILFLMV
ncbi:hypothetical protein VP01_2860g1 [Puccinia sorghi]|uniref:Uncharacterized protein n=1 Tax=Puccinia sorghi TaxID=27349 RepID=A0A0L6V2P1_9BASI|nr:hypothetical protein VP01_2860g1 [Puccinia sorghi]